MKTALKSKKLEQAIVLLKASGASFAAVFGSRAKGGAKPDSDYDILIEFKQEAHVGLFDLVELKNNLEAILGSKVDLGTMNSLDKYIKDEVLSSMVVLYDDRQK